MNNFEKDRQFLYYYTRDYINFDQMLPLKYEHNLTLFFMDEMVDDFNKDSNLGGGILEYTFVSDEDIPLIDNQVGLRSIDYRLKLEMGITWLGLWKIIDNMVSIYNYDCGFIRKINVKYEGCKCGPKIIQPLIFPFY